MESNERRALVIGASSGIGRATALRLSAIGFDVAAVGRRAERLDELASGTGARPIVADVSDAAQCDRLVTEAVQALGGIDLIIHAASSSRLTRLTDTSADTWHQVLKTNVVAPSLVLRAALPHLSGRAVGAVISSEIVGNPYSGLTPYAVSKAALEESVRGWREEHPEVRFCCIRVGATDGTEFARDFDPETAEELFPRWIEQGRIPDQFMDATELGNAIADTMRVAVESPGLDIQDLVIRAPGVAHVGGTKSLMDRLDAQQT